MRSAVVLALVLVGGWVFVVTPLDADVAALEERRARAVADREQGGQLSAALGAVERDIRELESSVAPIHAGTADETGLGTVLMELERAAARSGVRITSAKPRAASRAKGPSAHSIDVEIEGGYHAVGRFLSEAAASASLICARELTVRTRAGRTTASVEVSSIGGRVPLTAAADAAAYDDGGGRDPFVSVIQPKPAPQSAVAPSRGRGLGAAAVAGVTIRGVARAGNRRLAILETPDKQSFVIHPMDRLADGVVQDIDDAGVVFGQQQVGTGESGKVRKALGRAQGAPR